VGGTPKPPADSASVISLPELIEAGVRSGKVSLAEDSLRRLSAITVAGSDWTSDIEARFRAPLGDGEPGNAALKRSSASAAPRCGPDLARAHHGAELVARLDPPALAPQPFAVQQAYDIFAAVGAEAFADRARLSIVEAARRSPDGGVQHQHHQAAAAGHRRSYRRPAGSSRPEMGRGRLRGGVGARARPSRWRWRRYQG
jgi:hypothetical protein